MNVFPIDRVIPESNIIVFCPHYDDFLFMLGGYINELKKNSFLNSKKIHINIIFSRSNYVAGTGKNNFDNSLDRLKLATGKRLLEDQECMNDLLGEFNYGYALFGENECFVRGKSFADSEMEFPHGMYADFDDKDRSIFERMKERVRLCAASKDIARAMR